MWNYYEIQNFAAAVDTQVVDSQSYTGQAPTGLPDRRRALTDCIF